MALAQMLLRRPARAFYLGVVYGLHDRGQWILGIYTKYIVSLCIVI